MSVANESTTINMRIAASTYLNSAPLAFSFAAGQQRARATFLGDTAPSRCARMLAQGQCDIALIPVIEYQRIPNLRLIRNVAVACKSRIRSVVLASRCELSEARTITLDSASRTAQALVKILLARHYNNQPGYQERRVEPHAGCANMLEGSDAALVIGDPAFRLEAHAAETGLQIYDLAAEWRTMTGLPFVFAVWAVREDALEDFHQTKLNFLEAKAEGLKHAEEIAAEYVKEIGLPHSELLKYLSENVNYDLDEENLAGLQLYFQMARECGLIDEARPLKFADD